MLEYLIQEVWRNSFPAGFILFLQYEEADVFGLSWRTP